MIGWGLSLLLQLTHRITRKTNQLEVGEDDEECEESLADLCDFRSNRTPRDKSDSESELRVGLDIEFDLESDFELEVSHGLSREETDFSSSASLSFSLLCIFLSDWDCLTPFSPCLPLSDWLESEVWELTVETTAALCFNLSELSDRVGVALSLSFPLRPWRITRVSRIPIMLVAVIPTVQTTISDIG